MKIFTPSLVALTLVSLLGCQPDVKKADQVAVLDSEIKKQSYGLGASIGLYMEKNLEAQKEMGLTLDKQLIEKGFIDSLAGKSLLQDQEIQSLLTKLDETMKEKQQVLAEQQAEQSLLEGQKFLTENAKKTGVTTTNSGIQYVVINDGQGAKPQATDTVKVHYKGSLLNGDTFDSSYERGEPAVFPLNRVISGWTEAVQLMPIGSKYKFTIPSELAYGEQGNPPNIPGNSVLEFEIELLDIQQPNPVAQVGQP
jgi:FKBP-type peptidyl-prolyl cis-trans isomerase FkpA